MCECWDLCDHSALLVRLLTILWSTFEPFVRNGMKVVDDVMEFFEHLQANLVDVGQYSPVDCPATARVKSGACPPQVTVPIELRHASWAGVPMVSTMRAKWW